MSGSLLGAWWPLSGSPNIEPSEPPSNVKQGENGSNSEVTSQSHNKSSYFWSWPAGSAPDLRETIDSNSAQNDPPQPNEESVSWWTALVGSSTKPFPEPASSSMSKPTDDDSARQTKNRDVGVPDSNVTVSDVSNQQQSSWFFWPLFSKPQQEDSESDTEDKRDLEAFREAKLLVETSKDSCHYAVSKIHGSNEVYLSVHATSTETSPVKFNEKRQPMMPHQYLEKVISDQRSNKLAESQQDEQSGRLHRATFETEQMDAEALKIPKSQTQDSGSQNLPASSSSKSLKNGTMAPRHSSNISIDDFNGIKESNIDLPSPVTQYESGILDPVSPTLDSNLRVITLPTKLRLWGESILLKESSSERHIYKSTNSSVERKRKQVSKKALVISVHSFLPTKFVRSVISQSTGSAALIAENAVSAVQRWAVKGGLNNLQIQSISLDGIGTIESRAEKSLCLLKNWTADINSSDFVFVVSNSTASPAAISILDQILKLTEFELSHKKIGFLSMSGAFHGPVTGLDAKIIRRAYGYSEYEIIKELFELQRSASDLSKKLAVSINELCQTNVKLAFVGSVDDQFIPVFSSISHQMSHPNLFKCLYIDSSTEVPKFIIRLISIILTMENVGYSDHYQLLRDLSELSQGPLATCASHGDIFKCPDAYDIGVKFALETTSLKLRKIATSNQTTHNLGDTERNLYHLPWHVRGLINDLLQTKHIKSVKLLKDLVRDYRSWDPAARTWREIKQCFAAFEETNPDDLLL